MCEDYTMYILNEKIAEITVDDELGMDNEEIMQRQSKSIMMCYNFRGRGRVGETEKVWSQNDLEVFKGLESLRWRRENNLRAQEGIWDEIEVCCMYEL